MSPNGGISFTRQCTLRSECETVAAQSYYVSDAAAVDLERECAADDTECATSVQVDDTVST